MITKKHCVLSILSHLHLRECLWNLYLSVARLSSVVCSIHDPEKNSDATVAKSWISPNHSIYIKLNFKSFHRDKNLLQHQPKKLNSMCSRSKMRLYKKAIHLLYCLFCTLRACRAFRVKGKEGMIQHVTGCTCRNSLLFSQDGGRKQDSFI